ncbi:MAG: phosphate-starvation-inducible protein PsiF [Alphaproteobacteria bacterium]|nr:phosphate-starvation-inducible protein PsiF [Alphaproteobacteria bacterium]
MRILLAAFALAAAVAMPAIAQQKPTAAQAAQQERMKTCNADASHRKLKGAARQDYMSACLAGKADPNTMMKVCNEQASQDKLTSDARKTFMSSCLKKSG